MDLKEIRELLKLVEKFSVTDFTLQRGEDSVRIRRGGGGDTPSPRAFQIFPPSPVPLEAPSSPGGSGQTPALGERSASTATVGENQFVLTSPIVGTFYRAPSPESPPYVQQGDVVSKGKVLCIVEAMKLMNEIECEVNGKVSAILVENAQPVEYGQPLFVIDLS